MLFSELAASQLPEWLKDVVERLLELKMTSPKIKMVPRIDVLNEYLDQSILDVRERIGRQSEEHAPDWEELNSLFLSALT